MSLKVTEALIERENQKQRRRWLEHRGELQHRPSRRLYGARAIGEEVSRLNPPLSGSPSLLSLTASLASLRRGIGGDRQRRQQQQRGFRAPSPTHSVSSLVLGAAPGVPIPPVPIPPVVSSSPGRHLPTAVAPPLPQPGPVVSEGLRTSLPSPTSSVSTFGEAPRDLSRVERRREKEREKERAKAEKEREKERARAEKEAARRQVKERERERRQQLKAQQRKGAKKKENGARDASPAPSLPPPPPAAAEPSSSIQKDGYF